MNSFKLLINRFDSILRNHNLPNYIKLYEPLSLKEIDHYFKSLNIDNEYLHNLFEWKNGYDPDQNVNMLCRIMDFGTLLSLEYISESVNINSKDRLWDTSFIPLITDSTGQYIMFNNKQGTDYGKLHLLSSSLLFAEEPISYYDSVYTMIETTIEAYEKEVLKYDHNKDWLNMDVKKFYEIAQKINKNSKYWTRKY
jgi:hypothetical protein